jgi:hypothetical protein
MFRCRSFPGQYLLLTLEQREGRLDQMAACSRNFWCKHSPVVTDRGYFGAVRLRCGGQKCRYRVAHSPAMRCTTSSPVVMRDGSLEGRRFESCRSLRAV